MLKAILFDWDMTLVDSKHLVKYAYLALCRAAGEKPTKRGIEEYCGNRLSVNIENFCNRNKKTFKGTKKDLMKVYIKTFEKYDPRIKFKGKNILNELRKRGVKIAIVSNNTKFSIVKPAKKYKIKYDVLIADEDLKKSDRKSDAIKKAIKKLKFDKSEVAYVGDHINDVIAAHKAGIKSMIVPSGVFSKETIRKFHPEFMLKNLNQILELPL